MPAKTKNTSAFQRNITESYISNTYNVQNAIQNFSKEILVDNKNNSKPNDNSKTETTIPNIKRFNRRGSDLEDRSINYPIARIEEKIF